MHLIVLLLTEHSRIDTILQHLDDSPAPVIHTRDSGTAGRLELGNKEQVRAAQKAATRGALFMKLLLPTLG